MALRIVDIRRVSTRDGFDVQGLSRTPRGQKFILKTVSVKTDGKTKAEIQKEVKSAVESFYPPT